MATAKQAARAARSNVASVRNSAAGKQGAAAASGGSSSGGGGSSSSNGASSSPKTTTSTLSSIINSILRPVSSGTVSKVSSFLGGFGGGSKSDNTPTQTDKGTKPITTGSSALDKRLNSTGVDPSNINSDRVKSAVSKEAMSQENKRLASKIKEISSTIDKTKGKVSSEDINSAVDSARKGNDDYKNKIVSGLLGGMSIDEFVANKNINRDVLSGLNTGAIKTGMGATDSIIDQSRTNQQENIDFLGDTKKELIDQNKLLETDAENTSETQNQVIQKRLDAALEAYNKNISAAENLGNIDKEKTNLIANQNAAALAGKLSGEGLLTSEQAQQAMATAVSGQNQQYELAKLDIDSKTAELISNANTEYASIRDTIMQQEGLDAQSKFEKIKELNNNYSKIIETYNTNALNEKKNVDATVIGLQTPLSGAETSGASQEIAKQAAAQRKLDQLEKTTRDPSSKMRYLFSELSSYFGSDPIIDTRINETLTKLQEGGTIGSMSMSSLFNSIANSIKSATMESAKARTIK